MINIRTIKKIVQGGGFTLKDGKIITYPTGWQIVERGPMVVTPKAAMKAVKLFKGDCCVWHVGEVYYVCPSVHVSTKEEALRIGEDGRHVAIWGWEQKEFICCSKAR